MGRVWTSQTVIIGTPYTGPGNVVSGAVFWGGLRAYSALTVGTNAIRLRESGGNTEQDFATIAGGGLNLSAISAFKAANQVFVTKLYDQTGNGIDLVQATAANQPEFQLGIIGSLPSIAFVRANNTVLSISNAGTIIQPFTVGAVAERTGSFGVYNTILAGQPGCEFDFRISANTLAQFTNSAEVTLSSVADSAFHAMAFIANGASSVISADGATGTSGNSGTTNLTSNNSLNMGGITVGTQVLDGFISEIGVWPVALTAGNISDLNSNQHTYWGF
jgi:hypothetical protein